MEVIQKSSGFLAKRGVDSPRLQSELLLAHLLRIPRLKLYLDFERILAESELAALRELVRRRGEHEPLQHLLGTVNFLGLEIKVTRDVLIPRPETELLAASAGQFLQQTGLAHPRRALDFGTGSGCLAIYLAGQSPAELHAVEISPAALAVARENATAHQLAGRIHFHQGDGFAALPAGLRFDLIVANPPYIPSAEIDTLQPEVRDHDPRLALDGGPDGLDCFRQLAGAGAKFLLPGGKLMTEFGEGQADALSELFQQAGWIIEAILPDDSQRLRLLIARPHGDEEK